MSKWQSGRESSVREISLFSYLMEMAWGIDQPIKIAME